jgi:ATP-binding cassette subfamily B protein
MLTCEGITLPPARPVQLDDQGLSRKRQDYPRTQPDMWPRVHDFIATLPLGLDTVVSERGTSLSGGQKQRVMLARALALNPKVLLLDDFTARVDANTERAILQNIQQNYPDITLISVTQEISSVENYHQIILLMEGEVLASGTHGHLMETSPEYVPIYES